MTTLRIELLGGFSLRLDNNPITLKTRKAESALAYLACGERPFSREELAAFFWPQSEPSQAAANLRKLLSELRRDLAPYLLIDRQSVALDPAADVWLDVTEFSQLAAEDDPDALATAVSLYHGDFLAGFYLRDSYHFDEWATLERERHQQVILGVLRQLASHHFHQGTYEEALPYMSRWLALNPLAETAHRLAMRLHARRGQCSLALAQFIECRRILEEELGVPPAPETVQLHQRIREAPQQPFNFPYVLPKLVGREAESGQISRLLEETAVRLLSLTGPGGIGKTSLALHTAGRCLTDFQHGVYFVSLENVTPGANPQEALITALAAVLQFPLSEKQPLQKQLIHYLSQKEMLLLLDNFEQFVPAAGFLKTVLAHAPKIKCLVTAQLPLNLPQETTLPLSGLAYPTGTATEESANRYPALRLFASSARQVVPHFSLTAESLPHICQICRFVDGLPLGVELAARAVRAFTPAQIALQLRQDPDFLTSRSRDRPDRHRGLRALFNCTWALLSPTEQAAFARLTIFPAPFTAVAAQTITGVTAAGLQKLMEKGLLRPGETNQYQMHNLLRHYGQEKLAGYEDTAQLQANHTNYYGRLLHQLQPDLDGARQNEALQTIRQILPHARRAWQWGIDQAKVPLLAQLVPALCRYFAINGLYQEASGWLERTITCLDGSQAGETPEGNRLLIQCLTERGAFLCGLAAYETAAYTLTTALEKAQNQDVPLETAACYRELGNLALIRGQLDQAEQQLNQSLQLYQEAENQRGLADVWHRLGQLHVQLSQPEKAQNAFSQSLNLYRQLEFPQGIAQALSGLALVVHYWTGAYAEAEPLYLEALTLKRELGHKHGMANTLNNLGNLACNLEAFERAITYYEESLVIKREIGLPLGIAITLANLGTAYHELAQYERAGELYAESLGISQKLGDQLGVLFCLGNLAELAHVQGEYARSERRWRRVMQLSLAAQSTDRLLYCLTGLACLWADTAVPPTNQTLAATMFYYVQTYPGSNQSVRDKIGPPLARLAERLPPDVLASAQADAAAWLEDDLKQRVEALLTQPWLYPQPEPSGLA